MRERSEGPDGGAGTVTRTGEWETAFLEMSRSDDICAITDGDTLQEFALATYMTGREDAYINLMCRAFEAFMGEGAPMRAARSAFWIGMNMMFRGEIGRGGGWLARAGHLIEENGSDCVETGYLLLSKVEQSFGAGDNEAAERIAEQALSIGARFGDEDLLAIARHLIGRARMALGNVPGGLLALDETMVDTTEGRLSPIVTGLIYCSVIEACQQFQIFRRASEWTWALSSWCTSQPELVAFTGRCLIHRSEILLFDGRWPEASREADAAIERLSEGHSAHHAGPALYQKGEVFRLRGQFEAADESYRAAITLGFDPQPGLSLMRLQQGKIRPAWASIRRTLAAADVPTKRMRLLSPAVEIALAADNWDAAVAYCNEMKELARTYSSEAIEATAAEIQGDLNLAAGEVELAVQCFTRAATIWRDMQAPYRLSRIRLRTARACVALDDREGGLDEARAAYVGFAKLGAEPDRKMAEAVIRQLDPGLSAILTPRQTEVLSLIARGLTNRAIADRLRLSERTVDRHVSDILTRIGVPTRAAAVAYAVSNRLIELSTSG